jgi:hypothetical protein
MTVVGNVLGFRAELKVKKTDLILRRAVWPVS